MDPTHLTLDCPQCGQSVRIPTPAPDSAVRIKCPSCTHSWVQEGGPAIQAQLGKNPFGGPIQDLGHSICTIQWEFPFIPQVLQFLITLVIVAVLCLLYGTIGIACQIADTFWDLIQKTGQRIQLGTPVERSAYAIAVGVYFLIFLPFWILHFPFYVLGMVWRTFGYPALIALTVIVIAVIIAMGYFHQGAAVSLWSPLPN